MNPVFSIILVLLRYDWHIALCKFQVCSIMFDLHTSWHDYQTGPSDLLYCFYLKASIYQKLHFNTCSCHLVTSFFFFFFNTQLHFQQPIWIKEPRNVHVGISMWQHWECHLKAAGSLTVTKLVLEARNSTICEVEGSLNLSGWTLQFVFGTEPLTFLEDCLFGEPLSVMQM